MRQTHMRIKSNSSGWTLPEMLVAIFMVAILAVAAIPDFSPMLEGLKLRTAAMNVQRALLTARTRAISDPNVHCGVVFKDSVLIIFPDSASAGTPYRVDVSDTASKYLGLYKLPKNIFVRSLASDTISYNCIVFRGDGSAKYGGTVYVVNKYNKTKNINVLATTGRIKVQ
jgi:prepilin-type N-terminal cleavage/methylation domain-containing protein